MQIEWKNYFDAIRCFHFLPNVDRMDRLNKELDRVGILHNPIFQYKYTYKTVFDTYIRQVAHTTCPTFTNPERRDLMMNLLLAYYQIFKESLGLGLQKVVVLEDDVVFTPDLVLLDTYMKAMPSDWDYIHFDRVLNSGGIPQLSLSRPVSLYYCTYFGGHWGTGFTAFSTRAMELFCTRTEEDLWPADCVLENRDPDPGASLHRYVPTTMLVHQHGLKEYYTRLYY